MAGDWIKLECTTPDKPEVYRMAECLEIAPEHVTGCLVSLWIWADQQTTDGNAVGVTRTLVDRKSGVSGFADAMLEVGWLTENDQGLTFPNFDRHNGKSAKSRALTAKRVAKYKQKSNDEGNAKVTQAPLPREEKRREEVKDISPNGDCDSPSETRKPAPPYQEILNLYHENCPTLPAVIKLSPARKQAIGARWRSELTDLDDWETYFKTVHDSDFLSGRSGRFKCGFDWLTKQANCIKVMEGNYD